MIPAPDLVVGGKYRLVRALASGGMGSVWIARHTQLEVEVAVKFMAAELSSFPSAGARFEREARAAAQLKSPHVVRIHDYGLEDGTPYIAMELFDGEDLAGLLDRERRLSLPRASEILAQAAKALRAAHEARIVHRDIKPSNLFLARESGEIVVKVLDFGIAKETALAGQQGATTTGVVLGSPLYMSPEQARGTSIDERSDLWSLGVVLFEMLTGEQPFLGASVGDVIAKICGDELPVPSRFNPDLSPDVDAFFARALARDPAGRFPSARALSDAFAAIAVAVVAPREVASRGRLETTQPVAAPAPIGPERLADTHLAATQGEPTIAATVAVTQGITVDPSATAAPRRRVAIVAVATIGAALLGGYALLEGTAPAKDPAIATATTSANAATATSNAAPTLAAIPPSPTAATSVAAPVKSAGPRPIATPTASVRAIPITLPSATKPAALPTPTIDPIFGLPVPK
ncbi:MAG: protein kinase [Byssovorax sp.]